MFKFQKILTGLVVLGHLMASISVMATEQEHEPNDKFGQALVINGQSVYAGTLDTFSGYDIDYYKVVIEGKGILTVNLDVDSSLDEAVNPNIKGYELSIHSGTIDNLIKRSNDALYRDVFIFNDHEFKIGLPKGEYFIKLRSNNRDIWKLQYQLSFNFSPTEFTELEPNDEFKTANTIKMNSTIEARRGLRFGTPGDYYALDVDSPKAVTVLLEQPNFAETYSRNTGGEKISPVTFKVTVYDEEQRRVVSFPDFHAKNSKEIKFDIELAQGKYFFRVECKSKLPGGAMRKVVDHAEYRFSVRLNLETK